MSYTISGLAEDLQRQAESAVKAQGEKLAQDAIAKASSAAGALARDPRARTTPAAASAADKARAIASAKAKARSEMLAKALTAKAVADAKINVFLPPDDPVTGPIYTTIWKKQRLIEDLAGRGKGPGVVAPPAPVNTAPPAPVNTAPPAADLPPVFVDENGKKTDDTGKPAGLSPVVIVGGLAVLGGLFLVFRK